MNNRTIERSDRIYLDLSIARCEPGLHCPMRSHCARYLASVPVSGAMFDGTTDPHWTPSFCGNYIPASKCIKSEPTKEQKQTRRYWDNSEW